MSQHIFSINPNYNQPFDHYFYVRSYSGIQQYHITHDSTTRTTTITDAPTIYPDNTTLVPKYAINDDLSSPISVTPLYLLYRDTLPDTQCRYFLTVQPGQYNTTVMACPTSRLTPELRYTRPTHGFGLSIGGLTPNTDIDNQFTEYGFEYYPMLVYTFASTDSHSILLKSYPFLFASSDDPYVYGDNLRSSSSIFTYGNRIDPEFRTDVDVYLSYMAANLLYPSDSMAMSHALSKYNLDFIFPLSIDTTNINLSPAYNEPYINFDQSRFGFISGRSIYAFTLVRENRLFQIHDLSLVGTFHFPVVYA